MFANNRCALNFLKLTVHFRNYSSNQSGAKKTIQHVKHTVAKEIKSYALAKYADYVKNYEKVLEIRFPRAMKVYRIFSVGIKEFYHDTKELIRVIGLARTAKKRGAGIESLKLKEIIHLYRMPREMMRVAPVLLISALPFANYIVFPVAYYFPKQLLSSHFWSLQQRHDFALQDHNKNVQHFRPLFRLMQARISLVDDKVMQAKMNIILSKLASGVHPTTAEILEIRILFQGEPYHLNCLYPRHKNHLLKIHGLHTLWSRRNRLAQRANEIQVQDKAMQREGIHSLGAEELRWACFTRGLNPTSMRPADMVTYLEQWLAISTRVDTSTQSLLLHCPILLGYNHPTNRMLIQ